MEAEKIIKEKEIVHEDEHKDYASKGVGNAGLTLGIIGTALGAWAVSRNRGGLFGGGWGAGMPEKKIIEDAVNFYFMDDDAPEGKVWIYMCAMDD